MSTLRQRKPGAAPANGLAEAGAGTNGAPRTVVIDSSSGYLGVTLSDVEDGVGVLIAQCDVMDLISRSGLKAGDRITKVNGKSVSSHSKALAAMTDKKADGRLEIEYYRFPRRPRRQADESRRRSRRRPRVGSRTLDE